MEAQQLMKKAFLDELEKIGAVLTADAREHIANKNFALTGKQSTTGKPAYPIDNIDRARSALRLVGMHGSEQQKAEVRRDVDRKYPELRKTSHTVGEYGRAALKGLGEEVPTALGAMGGLAVGKMIELKTGKKLNPIATSGVGYGVGGLADALLRKHHG